MKGDANYQKARKRTNLQVQFIKEEEESWVASLWMKEDFKFITIAEFWRRKDRKKERNPLNAHKRKEKLFPKHPHKEDGADDEGEEEEEKGQIRVPKTRLDAT